MSSYLMRPPRHFSNKENTSYAPSSPIASLLNPMNASSSTPGRAPSSVGSSSTAAASAAIRSHKHRLGGIGKAPRRIKTASKPYDRCASVTRAKKRAANAVGGPKGSKSAPASVCPGVEVTPPVPDFPLDPRLADPAPATATATAPAAPAAPVARMAEIPLRLPRPTIPLVSELTGEWAGVVSPFIPLILHLTLRSSTNMSSHLVFSLRTLSSTVTLPFTQVFHHPHQPPRARPLIISHRFTPYTASPPSSNPSS